MGSAYVGQDNCPFCRIFAGTEPATIVASLDKGNALVIVPKNPVVEGHVLVVPRVHVSDFMDNVVVAGETMAYASLHAARQRSGDWNLITSKGPAATQTVMHLHIHLIPRVHGDGLMLPWTNQKALDLTPDPGLSEPIESPKEN